MTKCATESERRIRSSLDSPIRVAYVVYRFDVGGLERCVANLCNRLDRDRFRPVVICLEQSGAAANWLERDDVEVVELGKRPRNDPGVVWRLASALRKPGVDVVHSHNWGTLVETTLARRWAGVPVHVHAERGTVLGTVNGTGMRYRLRAQAMRWALGRCEVVVSNAEQTARRIEAACGFPAARVHLIPNGVAAPSVTDPEQARRRIRNQLSIPERACVVGSVGRLVAVKNFTLAIDTIVKPVLRNRNLHLILVGEGPEQGSLRQHAIERNVSDRVHLVGQQADIGNWLAAMDVYVNTSLSEGMSQSIVEAMAAGLPLAVTDVGDSRALVEEGEACGVVVESGDGGGLANAIDALLQDSSRMAAFRRNSRLRFGERHELAQMVDAHQSCYAELWESAGACEIRGAVEANPAEKLVHTHIQRGGAVPR